MVLRSRFGWVLLGFCCCDALVSEFSKFLAVLDVCTQLHDKVGKR